MYDYQYVTARLAPARDNLRVKNKNLRPHLVMEASKMRAFVHRSESKTLAHLIHISESLVAGEHAELCLRVCLLAMQGQGKFRFTSSGLCQDGEFINGQWKGGETFEITG